MEEKTAPRSLRPAHGRGISRSFVEKKERTTAFQKILEIKSMFGWVGAVEDLGFIGENNRAFRASRSAEGTTVQVTFERSKTGNYVVTSHLTMIQYTESQNQKLERCERDSAHISATSLFLDLNEIRKSAPRFTADETPQVLEALDCVFGPISSAAATR